MVASVELSFDRLPNSTAMLAKALWPKPNVLRAGSNVPSLRAVLSPTTPDPKHVAAYRALCGFAHDSTLPVTYPHVLAAPLHLAVLTNAAFPLRLLGAVHVRNHIVQRQPLRADEPISIEVTVEGQTAVEGGVEVVMHTRANDAWESDSTMLIRGGRVEKKEGKTFTPPDFSSFELVATITAPDDIGRRYGSVAHDLNPIHMHALSAKAFGFPRAIAHGMWSVARCVAEMQRASVVGGCTLDVAFKRPLLLPGKAVLVSRKEADHTAYALHDGQGKTVFLTGILKS